MKGHDEWCKLGRCVDNLHTRHASTLDSEARRHLCFVPDGVLGFHHHGIVAVWGRRGAEVDSRVVVVLVSPLGAHLADLVLRDRIARAVRTKDIDLDARGLLVQHVTDLHAVGDAVAVRGETVRVDAEATDLQVFALAALDRDPLLDTRLPAAGVGSLKDDDVLAVRQQAVADDTTKVHRALTFGAALVHAQVVPLPSGVEKIDVERGLRRQLVLDLRYVVHPIGVRRNHLGADAHTAEERWTCTTRDRRGEEERQHQRSGSAHERVNLPASCPLRAGRAAV